MKILQSPEEYIFKEKEDKILIFLAGGITNCSNWQDSLIESLKPILKEKEYFQNLILINPKRESSIALNNEKEIIKQIKWEYKYLNQCDIFTMFFDDTKLSDQPICFYELGKYLNQFQNIYKTNFEDHIIISFKNGFRRDLDLKIQIDLATNSKIKPIQINEINEYSKIICDKIDNLFKKTKKIRNHTFIEEKENQIKFYNDSFNKYVKKIFYGDILPSPNFKIGILGSKNVGKTLIMNWFIDGRFIYNFNSDKFENKCCFEVEFNNKNIIIEFEDFNQEEYEMYLKDKNCILLVYDICKKESLEEITNEYLPKVLNNKNIIKVIVGNKLDREFDRKISCNEVEEMSYKVNIELFEVSVKSSINMNNLFKYVMKELSKN